MERQQPIGPTGREGSTPGGGGHHDLHAVVMQSQEERSARWLALLGDLIVALGEAETAEQITDVIGREGLAALEASACALSMSSAEASDPRDVAFGAFPLGAQVALPVAVRTRDPIFLETQAECARQYPVLGQIYGEVCPGAIVALPLVVADRTLGGIEAHWPGDRAFDAADRSFKLTVAGLCAQALERARLHDREQQIRSAADETTRILDALVENIPADISSPDAPDAVIHRLGGHGPDASTHHPGALEGIPHGEHASRWAIYHVDGFTPATVDELPMTRALKHGEIVEDEEWVLQRPSGEMLPMVCSAGPIRDASGTITGAIVAWRDITQRKRLEAALHARDVTARRKAAAALRASLERLRLSEERYRSLVNATTAIVWTGDAEGNFVQPQPSWEAYTGQSWEQHQARGWLQMVHPDDRAILIERWNRAKETRSFFEVEGRLWHEPTGEYRHSLARALPLLDDRGRIREWMGTALDIDASRRAQEQIADLNRRLHRSVYESSHRIKNHLQFLAAIADLALMDGSELVPAAQVRRLGTQARMLAQIHDLLTVETRIDAEAQTLPVKALLVKVLSAMPQGAAGGHVRFDIEDAPVPARHASALALAVNELVSNSLKHGGADVEVAFRTDEGMGILEVRDDGPGFSPGFDPALAANTGLELIASVVRADLRGDVRYERPTEGGARVVLTFPLEHARPDRYLP
jgi:PAS domain S-box-containing protein